MTLDPDVRGMASHFGISAQLIQAVVKAEGNIVRAVQCSVPSVQTREKALDVTCRSAVHAMSDYVFSDPARAAAFIEMWGARWAPEGAENDPTGLNGNWVTNVKALLGVKA